MTRMHVPRLLVAALVAACLAAACGNSGAEETGSGGIPESGNRATTTTAEATTTTEAPTSTTAAGEEPEVTIPEDADVAVQIEVQGDEVSVRSSGGGEPGRVIVDADDRVQLEVTADRAETVLLHGYGLSAPVSPGMPATIDFVADRPGLFLVELTPSHQFLVQLAVEP
jgi:hypothetical protein